ncbi:class I SAM-dependent methyltransferase [Nocardioides aequoreus]|uniref:class I SAM-dependent methyltransferase n=1 Tax=Nocardioides aequoreus TaxID=397278 RepID=UPI0004C43F83|nr:class I SAM-dependent methyltransferase [Nocardioides aequoreus]
MSDERADHWDAVFASRDLDKVSWFEETPTHSVELLRRQPGSVVDIGAGASRLPDALLTDGRDDITVLDISHQAVAVTRERLGSAKGRVTYVVSDVLSWKPARTYDAWHDRAVLHFLTAPADQSAYVDLAARTLSPGGLLVLATFGPDGPTSCSGLPTARHSADDFAALFAPAFTLTHAETRIHHTPDGSEQQFTWVTARRTGDSH